MKTIEKTVPATLDFAKGLFTRSTDAFGAEEIERVFGVRLEQVPPIPFSEGELRRARELNQYLILQVNVANDGRSLTMKKIHGQFDDKLGDGKLLYDTDWYNGEVFFTKDSPRFGWVLVSREVIPGSTCEDYISQTQALADYLVNEVYKDEELPDEYRAAVDEFASRKEELEKLRDSDWKKAAEELANLKLNRLFRETPVEALYGLVVQHQVNHKRLLEEMWTWTNQRSSLGYLVDVGKCDSGGVRVVGNDPDFSNSSLGVRFFRSGIPNLES